MTEKKCLTRLPESAIIQSQAEGRRTRVVEKGVCPKGYKMVTKIFFKKIEKSVDIPGQMCYNKTIKGNEKIK